MTGAALLKAQLRTAASLDEPARVDLSAAIELADSHWARVKPCEAAVLEAAVGEPSALVRNFVGLLAEKGRAGNVEGINAELERMIARAEGQLSVTLTTAQLAMLLEGLDWRTPTPSWKPEIAV